MNPTLKEPGSDLQDGPKKKKKLGSNITHNKFLVVLLQILWHYSLLCCEEIFGIEYKAAEKVKQQ